MRDLDKRTSSLEELTFVLNTIANIWQMSEDVEMKYLDVMESYRTLSMNKIVVDAAELEKAHKLPIEWEAVKHYAKEKDVMLVPIKIQFTQTTKDQVKTFQAEIHQFRNDFFEKGK